MIFLDTSALYALAVADDVNHKQAQALFARILEDGEILVLHNLILVETVALLQRRQGYKTARNLVREAQYFKTIIIDERLHRVVLKKFTSSGKRSLSLVDMFSFALMKSEGIKKALAFDRHFERDGFVLYPG